MTSSLRSQTALAAVLATLALAPGAALAAPAVQAEFDSLDADKDGYVTDTEWRYLGELYLGDTRAQLERYNENGRSVTAEMLRPVNQLDDDRDRKLSFAEYRRGRIRGARFRFSQADINTDGVVTRDEYFADFERRVSPTRYAEYTDAQKADREKGLKIQLEKEIARFASLDSDGDGIISRGEMVPAETPGALAPPAPPAITLHAEFAAMDADKDGYISATELQIPTDGFGVLPIAVREKQTLALEGVNLYGPDGKELRVRIARSAEDVAAEGEVLVTGAQLRQLLLNRFETNGDQKLDLGEYAVVRIRGAEKRFDDVDVDLDGRLTREEFLTGFTIRITPEAYANFTESAKANYVKNTEARRIWASERFTLLDTNHDGVVSREEMIPS